MGSVDHGESKAQAKTRHAGVVLVGQDGCWFCKVRNNCNQCKANRSYMKESGQKKEKGRTAGTKRERVRDIEYKD